MTNRQSRQVSRQVRADMRAENTGEAGKQTRNGIIPGGITPRGCKEKGCQGRIPTGMGLISWFCQMLGYCRYCYRMNYPKRHWTLRTEGRKELETPLTIEDRLEMEQAGFNTEVWSKAFYREMEDYWFAVMRGEIRI